MSKTDPRSDPRSDHYSNNKNTSFPFYGSFLINISNAYTRSLSSSIQFNRELLNAFAEA
jgi:hypothetical protein